MLDFFHFAALCLSMDDDEEQQVKMASERLSPLHKSAACVVSGLWPKEWPPKEKVICQPSPSSEETEKNAPHLGSV